MKEKEKESNKHINKKRTYRQNPKTIVKTTLNIQDHPQKLTHLDKKRSKKKEEIIKIAVKKSGGWGG